MLLRSMIKTDSSSDSTNSLDEHRASYDSASTLSSRSSSASTASSIVLSRVSTDSNNNHHTNVTAQSADVVNLSNEELAPMAENLVPIRRPPSSTTAADDDHHCNVSFARLRRSDLRFSVRVVHADVPSVPGAAPLSMNDLALMLNSTAANAMPARAMNAFQQQQQNGKNNCCSGFRAPQKNDKFVCNERQYDSATEWRKCDSLRTCCVATNDATTTHDTR